METLDDFLATIENADHRTTLKNVIERLLREHSGLELAIKWNQPMLTDHGTFVLGFSAAKPHYAIAPERLVLDEFRAQIERAGFEHTKALMKVKWEQELNFELLSDIITHTREIKKNVASFWLK